ncbi:neuroendocrine protein 7B2-like isoform X2 [Haliotis asinina]|uniref:neuroendocrine protein 7B2-like isoform X2 n=1 Tax=Haliotis asinina TaxID=109174 RepID=UPI0035325B28
MMKLFLVLTALVSLSVADFSLDRSYDTLVDLARLYRMQNLNSFDDYTGDDIDSRSGDWAAPYGDAMYKDPQFGGTHLRDQEHIEQSSLFGSQSITGGATGSKSKSDKPLPAYCNPPNPCPIGYNAKDNNCVENFNNSADYNRELMAKQDCPCDTEHMFACPEGRGTVSSKSQGDSAAIKQNSFMPDETKRESLVAKKSPELSRNKRSTAETVPNPYFVGQIMRVTAKKSPTYKYKHQ